MRVLQVHNFYASPGGEEVVLEHERQLLASNGHQVDRYTVDNQAIADRGLWSSFRAGLSFVWSRQSYTGIGQAIREFQPDVVHVHNIFPLLSPSVYWSASRLGVPVVQTLHNFRLACANGLLMRDGLPCQQCIGNFPLPALKNRCYGDSLSATSAMVLNQLVHRFAKTYSTKIQAFIALTDFAGAILVKAGLPPERVHVKPNFVPVASNSEIPGVRRNQIVFVGRLSPIKGIDLILEAWRRTCPSDFELVIVGDGPDRDSLQSSAADLPGIRWRGWLNPEDVLTEIGASRALVMASRSYENFPMVLLEAFATRTPVIVPNHAGFPEIVEHGQNGLLFTPGDVEGLANAIRRIVYGQPSEWEGWSEAAFHRYTTRYSPAQNYAQLMEIYRCAVDRSERSLTQ